MCILLYVKPFGVALFHTSVVHWMGYICPKYIVHSAIGETYYIYGQLEEGVLGTCALCYL